jgi:hypothetical protein
MLIHILRAPYTVNWDVEGILASLDKYELRFVRGRICGGCEVRLDYAGCGTYGGMPPCSQHVRARRLENLLATYKPRLTRRKKR